MKRVLIARQDNNGDVLLAGPAVRAVAASASVTILCGPRGEPAARLLPGAVDVIVSEAAWIDAEPEPVRRSAVLAFVDQIAARNFDEAIVLTSFHQSPLPLALLLRMAGVARIGAVSVDYPGTLLDVRHQVADDVHEVERSLSLVRAMGYELPAGDDGALRIRDAASAPALPFEEYVVVHPGATVPARAWFPERNAQLVERLSAAGRNVVVTGSLTERELTQAVCGFSSRAIDLGGRTTFAEFTALVAGAQAAVCGNTATAHVAAAVGTPVVSIFPPTIPATRFRPWRVAHVLLGDQQAPCAGCRSRICPIEGQPCLAAVTVEKVYDAVCALSADRTERPVCA